MSELHPFHAEVATLVRWSPAAPAQAAQFILGHYHAQPTLRMACAVLLALRQHLGRIYYTPDTNGWRPAAKQAIAPATWFMAMKVVNQIPESADSAGVQAQGVVRKRTERVTTEAGLKRALVGADLGQEAILRVAAVLPDAFEKAPKQRTTAGTKDDGLGGTTFDIIEVRYTEEDKVKLAAMNNGSQIKFERAKKERREARVMDNARGIGDTDRVFVPSIGAAMRDYTVKRYKSKGVRLNRHVRERLGI